ncbi:MAG TPA: hypothetical protein VIR65_15570 [Rhizorhapis sp.]
METVRAIATLVGWSFAVCPELIAIRDATYLYEPNAHLLLLPIADHDWLRGLAALLRETACRPCW